MSDEAIQPSGNVTVRAITPIKRKLIWYGMENGVGPNGYQSPNE